MKKSIMLVIVFVLLLSCLPSVMGLSAAVRIPEKYTEVKSGERVYFEIEIKYPENPSRKDITLNYEVKKGNEIIASSKVLKAVETQASFMDFLVIPETAQKGLYKISVIISDYDSLNEDISASFNVITQKDEQVKFYFLITIGVVVLMGILVLLEIFLMRKK
jgi:hypothetical protein